MFSCMCMYVWIVVPLCVNSWLLDEGLGLGLGIGFSVNAWLLEVSVEFFRNNFVFTSYAYFMFVISQ